MISGFLLVNKEPGITSSRVVQIIKKQFNLNRVSHLGTLDPMASGLLIIAINRATKFASLLLQSEKSYRAEITLGIQTDTDDAEGKIISCKDVNINESQAKKIPIIKQPIKFTVNVPKGNPRKTNFERSELKRNLEIAPKKAPTPIKR